MVTYHHSVLGSCVLTVISSWSSLAYKCLRRYQLATCTTLTGRSWEEKYTSLSNKRLVSLQRTNRQEVKHVHVCHCCVFPSGCFSGIYVLQLWVMLSVVCCALPPCLQVMLSSCLISSLPCFLFILSFFFWKFVISNRVMSNWVLLKIWMLLVLVLQPDCWELYHATACSSSESL